MKILFTLSFYLLGLSIALAVPKPISKSKVKKAVKNAIEEQFPDKNYINFFYFSDVHTVKPIEIQQLDSLYEVKKTVKDTVELQLKINKYLKIVGEEGLHTKHFMTTLFEVEIEKNSYRLIEVDYELSPRLKVIGVDVLMDLKIDQRESDLFFLFNSKIPIIEYEDGTGHPVSDSIYSDMYVALSKANDKELLLRTFLTTIEAIRYNNEYNEKEIARYQVDAWIYRNSSSYPMYVPKQYSKLLIEGLEKQKEGMYRLYHKINCEIDGETKQLVLYFELDKYFVITKVEEVNASYEKYFK